MTGRSEGLPLEPIWQAPDAAAAAEVRGGLLPTALAGRYSGNLAIPLRPDRPTVIANFVSSLDGVVSLGGASGSGGEISGFSESDRFMMSLLRGLADVIVVGAGTVRAGSRHEWTSRRLQPGLADEFAAWRAQLGLAPQPTTILVTARGNLDPAHPGLNAPDVPVIVATTAAGAAHLATLPLPRHVAVEIAADDTSVPAGALLEIVRGTGARLALCEGGPHLFGDLLRARLIDELFLTLAPQIVGRDETATRLSFAEGATFGGPDGRWARLSSVRHAGDDLFLRYRFEP